MTDAEIKQVLAPMVVHVGKAITNEQIRYWHQMLNDLDFEAARRAIVLTIRDYQYAGFPPVGLVRRNAGAAPRATLTSQDRACLAWTAVKAAVRQHGAYATVSFDDPITNAVIRAFGGWVAVCDTAPGERFDTWLRKEFERLYGIYLASGISADQAAPLAGLCDQENGGRPVHQVATGANGLRLVKTNLPEVDKKLIRGVIREPKRLVAEMVPQEFVKSLGELPESSLDEDGEERSREEIVRELELADRKRGLKVASSPAVEKAKRDLKAAIERRKKIQSKPL